MRWNVFGAEGVGLRALRTAVPGFSGDAKPSREAWRLAYWCNNKRLFNAMDFADYKCK